MNVNAKLVWLGIEIIAIKSLMDEYFHGHSHLGGIMPLDSSYLFILGLFKVHS